MALHIPYQRTTFRPELPGSGPERPVEFDLVPAEGPDLARLKSVLFGSVGLTDGADWSPATQEAVTAALDKGRDAFASTVEAIRHLTVPAALAKRVGLIEELPETVQDGETVPNPDAPIPVRNGREFARICGFVPILAFVVAMEVIALSNKADIDLRFFGSRSGAGGRETSDPTPTTASSARPPRERRATAAGRKATR